MIPYFPIESTSVHDWEALGELPSTSSIIQYSVAGRSNQEHRVGQNLSLQTAVGGQR